MSRILREGRGNRVEEGNAEREERQYRVEGTFVGWYGNLILWNLSKIYKGTPNEVSKSCVQ